jgi:diguanylate cyclase (GGDEF)-like protein
VASSREKLLEVIQMQTEIARLGADLGEVMALVVERTLDLVGADGAAIELAEGGDMVYRATSGIARSSLGLRLKRETSLSGLCVSVGETLRCDDTETDTRVDREACRRVGCRSMIVMPLEHAGTPVGVLKAVSSQCARFDAAAVELLELLSGLVSASMFFAAKYDTEALFHKATHDAMTDLANRSLFMDRLRSAVSRCDRDKQPAGLLIVDMDGLKQTNDTFGHRIGDAVIIEFSRRLRNAARSSDTVARLGGDEFGVILTPIESTSLPNAISRIASELTTPFMFEERLFALRASIGGATVPDDGCEPDRLIEIADLRMYEAKRRNRSGVSAVQ